jgi:acetylornithine deacetylase
MNIQIDRDYLIQTLSDLVRINSINPSLVPGAPGEAEIAAYVAQALRDIKLDVRTHEPETGRVSVVGTLKGSGRGRSLMLNAHLDVVGPAGMLNPFTPEIRDGRMYGRGTFDMKGSLAACMTAAKALTDAAISLGGDLLVAAVADEEYASIGTADLVKHYQVDGAIVTEPTDMEICLAHRGFIWLEVETIGRAAHGSRYDLGIDANMRMGRFLAELDKLEQDLRARPPHPLVGPPSLHAAIIQGGSELSMYAPRCTLQIERRIVPGETEAQVVSELQAIIDKLSAADPTFQATVKPFFVRNPFEVSPDAAIVNLLQDSATTVLGQQAPLIGLPPWMDSALLSAAGVETVVMGPIGTGAHADVEWVDLESVENFTHILVQTVIKYCR